MGTRDFTFSNTLAIGLCLLYNVQGNSQEQIRSVKHLCFHKNN